MSVHYLTQPLEEDASMRDGLLDRQARVAVRDLLERYGKTGAELRLSIYIEQEQERRK